MALGAAGLRAAGLARFAAGFRGVALAPFEAGAAVLGRPESRASAAPPAPRCGRAGPGLGFGVAQARPGGALAFALFAPVRSRAASARRGLVAGRAFGAVRRLLDVRTAAVSRLRGGG